MRNHTFILYLMLLLASTVAQAQDYRFKTTDQFNQPASKASLLHFESAMKNSPFTEFEVESGKPFIMDQFDQVWLIDDGSKAVIFKIGVEFENKKLIGKLVKFEDGYLAQRATPDGSPYLVYFYQMSESAAKTTLNKLSEEAKTASIQKIWNKIQPTSAQAGLVPEACKNATNIVQEVKSSIKNGFKGSRWKCFKSFVVAKSGNFLNAIMEKVVDFQNGTIWKKLGNSLRFIQGVLSAFTDQTVVKNTLDLRLLKNKKQAELVCSALGETSRDTKDLVNSTSWNSSFFATIRNKFIEIFKRKIEVHRGEIEKERLKSPIDRCIAQTNNLKTEVQSKATEVKETYDKVKKGR